MPGLVGIITKQPRAAACEQLERMIGSMLHETFYVHGRWLCEELGVYVGWVARAGSFASQMPVQNEARNLTLLFAGEELSSAEHGAGLRAQGHAFDAGNPASALVHLAEEQKDFPRQLNGRFHGLLADERASSVLLFVDRFGMERLYVHESADAFYFAAEAKALLAVLPELRSIDERALAEFISCGCTLNNRSLFSGIRVLAPASLLRFEDAHLVRESKYFDQREWEEQEKLPLEEYYAQMRASFAHVLPRYLQGPERVAMSLTGGLDSRMIMAWSRMHAGDFPCYSFGGPYRASFDVSVAQKVASACHQPHETIHVGGEFLDRFAHYAERTVYLTDGLVEPKHAPDLYVNEIARQIAPARLTGNYGGEVMRHVRAFKPARRVAGLWHAELERGFDQAESGYRALLDGHALSFAIFRQAPWHHFTLLSLEQSQLTLRSPFLDNDFLAVLYRAPEEALTSDALSMRLIADGNPRLTCIMTDRGLYSGLPALFERQLMRWQTFTSKAEYAYDYGMPQRVARIDHKLRALHLERLFLGRHKFYHFRVWYRDALGQTLRDVLLDPRALSRPYLDGRRVEQMVAGHLRGDENHTTEVHKLLALEYLHRMFVD